MIGSHNTQQIAGIKHFRDELGPRGSPISTCASRRWQAIFSPIIRNLSVSIKELVPCSGLFSQGTRDSSCPLDTWKMLFFACKQSTIWIYLD